MQAFALKLTHAYAKLEESIIVPPHPTQEGDPAVLPLIFRSVFGECFPGSLGIAAWLWGETFHWQAQALMVTDLCVWPCVRQMLIKWVLSLGYFLYVSVFILQNEMKLL